MSMRTIVFEGGPRKGQTVLTGEGDEAFVNYAVRWDEAERVFVAKYSKPAPAPADAPAPEEPSWPWGEGTTVYPFRARTEAPPKSASEPAGEKAASEPRKEK